MLKQNYEDTSIKSVTIDDEANGGDGMLIIEMVDGRRVEFSDTARSCCESRYMNSDDDLPYYVGAIFLGAEERDGPEESNPRDYDYVECQFLVVNTSAGAFTVASYNSHNGYCGGIHLHVEEHCAPAPVPAPKRRTRKR